MQFECHKRERRKRACDLFVGDRRDTRGEETESIESQPVKLMLIIRQQEQQRSRRRRG